MSKSNGRRLSERDVEEIVLDSESLGVAEAAKRHGISQRTVERYRARTASDPRVRAAVDRQRAEQARAAREPLSAAQQKLLDRILALASDSKSLRDCAGAFKLVSDVIASDLIYATILGDGDARTNDPKASDPTPMGGLGLTQPRSIAPKPPKPPESA